MRRAPRGELKFEKKKGAEKMEHPEYDYYAVYDYSFSEQLREQAEQEAEEKRAARTPEEKAAFQQWIAEKYQELYDFYVPAREALEREMARLYEIVPNRNKEKQFLQYAEMVRDLAKFCLGCSEIFIQDHVGTIGFRSESIVTDEEGDITKDILAYLMIKANSILLEVQEEAVALRFTFKLYEQRDRKP